MPRWLRRLVFWLQRDRRAAELQEEIETHRLLREAALRRAGSADPAAASRRALGSVALACDDARDVWIPPRIDGLLRDVRQALRGLRRHPAFAVTALCTLAIGTGTLASVLSVFHAVLLRPAPYPTADRIVQIGQVVNGRNRSEASTVDVLALRAASPSLAHVSIAWFSDATLAGSSLPQRARRVYTDWHAFEMLGVPPLLGRLPTAADETPSAEPVVVIGHQGWSDWFGADRGVIGRTLRIDGREHVVIGVMPAGFRYPAPYWAPGDLWLLRGPSHPSWPDSRARIVLAFGLLEVGATLERAQAEADAAAAGLDARYPNPAGRVGLRLTTWADAIRTAARPRVWLLLSAGVALFLLVCGNVANLLVSRGVDREREFAARVALGAGAARLARQLLTETAVLFLIGGSAGVVAALWGTRLLVALSPIDIPGMDTARVEWEVVAAAIAITLAAATLVGLVPACQAASAHKWSLGAVAARGTSRSRAWRRLQSALVAIQVGIALVLLCGAAVLLEGARTLARADAGFDPRGLVQARVGLSPDRYPDLAPQAAFYDRVIEGLRRIPGVTAAAAVNLPPGAGGSGSATVLLDTDPPAASGRDLRPADVRVVSVGYLEALGLTPKAGRFPSSADSRAVPIAVVNEAFVRRYLRDAPPLGRTLRVAVGGADDLDSGPRTIVGVVRDLKEKTLYEPSPPTVYVPLDQIRSSRVALRMALIVRSGRPIGDLIPVIRRTVAEVDPDQAASRFMDLGELMQHELSLNRLNLVLLGVVSTVALFLSVIGVYGLAAHAVRQRTREIGIRLALGDSRLGVMRLVSRQIALAILLGSAGGLIAAVWLTDLLRSVVHGIDRTSLSTFAGAVVVLAAAVSLGSCFPLRRASSIDPAVVLRSE